MLIQIHILQNYAPANLNRDDTGAPKDAVFGGVRRGRISSQCLKRSIRRSAAFKEAFEAEDLLGVRTKMLSKLIADELEALGIEEDVCKAILGRIPEIGRESRKPSEEAEAGGGEEAAAEETELGASKQLIFIGKDELRPMAEKLVQQCRETGVKDFANPKKTKIADITKALGNSAPRSVDIALFGRMTTSAAFQNVEAAAQVAHAISTNRLEQEFDYYTAVDDLSGESGAGMIGDVEFNSSTYYKYMNIHWDGLLKNLGGNLAVAEKAVLALVEAAAFAQPSGKQNTFAAYNLPDLLLVEVSQKNLPVSYANAFIKPARASGERSVMDDSAAKLADYMKRVSDGFNLDSRRAFLALNPYELPDGQLQASLADLKQWVARELAG
jgi:CRISPR system Cascade subunit CasC